MLGSYPRIRWSYAWSAADWALLRCPTCHAALLPAKAGATLCSACGESWPYSSDIPILFREAWVRGTDKVMALFYDNLPRFHDPAVHYLLPVWQLEGRESTMRSGYIRRLQLDAEDLQHNPAPRLLEVSLGTGVNVGLVRRAAATGPRLEYWGLELSPGMLRIGCERLAAAQERQVRLVQGDAHALPFASDTFDRVLHVGGIGGFRDPGAAMAEMVRVAKPGAVIVVVDEQLDPARRHGLWPRAWFKALTFYDRDPHCPRESLPAGAIDVIEEQVSRFYYCLSFRKPVTS